MILSFMEKIRTKRANKNVMEESQLWYSVILVSLVHPMWLENISPVIKMLIIFIIIFVYEQLKNFQFILHTFHIYSIIDWNKKQKEIFRNFRNITRK